MNIPSEYQLVIIAALAIALTAVSIVFGMRIAELKKKVRVLFGGDNADENDFHQTLAHRAARAEAKLEELERRLTPLEAIGQISVQKTGFMRFNPFDDTGGDNSFVLALLDRENNGILVSSLYMREGMRVYAKKIEKGTTNYQLSAEEKKVLEEAVQK